jgi:hypothetical protein
VKNSASEKIGLYRKRCKEDHMKIFHITLAACLLSTILMAGCRNRTTDTTVPSTTRPSTVATTAPRQTVPSTAPATLPMPSVTMPGTSVPQGTDASPATKGTDGILDPGSMMPQRGGRR